MVQITGLQKAMKDQDVSGTPSGTGSIHKNLTDGQTVIYNYVATRAPASTALSSAVWTADRAGYLDKLNVAGALAHTGIAASFKADVSSLALEASAQAVYAKVQNLPEGFKKNQAFANFRFEMQDANGALQPGKTVTAKVSLDAQAGFSSTVNSPAEVGLGVYRLDLAAADLNGNSGTLLFEADGCVPLVIHFKTTA